MVLDYIQMLKDYKEKDYGKMEKELDGLIMKVNPKKKINLKLLKNIFFIEILYYIQVY